MISQELENFYIRWLQKADEYQNESLQDCFDRFFTLFVAYNRLYAELALSRVKKGLVKTKRGYIPDSLAAKNGIQGYLGTQEILQCLESETVCTEALHPWIH